MRVYARCARERKKAGSIVDWASDAPLADDENGRGESEEGNRVTVRPMSSEPNDPTRGRLPALKLRRHIITWSCVTRHTAFCRERVLTSSFERRHSTPLSPSWKRARPVLVAHTLRGTLRYHTHFPPAISRLRSSTPGPHFSDWPCIQSLFIPFGRIDFICQSFNVSQLIFTLALAKSLTIPNRLVDNAPAPNLRPPTSPGLAVPRLESNVYTNTPLKSY